MPVTSESDPLFSPTDLLSSDFGTCFDDLPPEDGGHLLLHQLNALGNLANESEDEQVLARSFPLPSVERSRPTPSLSPIPTTAQDSDDHSHDKTKPKPKAKRVSRAKRNKARREPIVRAFICGLCGRAFYRQEHLVRHDRIHSGERPYPCSVPGCDRQFGRSDELARHQKVHLKDLTARRRRYTARGTKGKKKNRDASSPTTASCPSAELDALESQQSFALSESATTIVSAVSTNSISSVADITSSDSRHLLRTLFTSLESQLRENTDLDHALPPAVFLGCPPGGMNLKMIPVQVPGWAGGKLADDNLPEEEDLDAGGTADDINADSMAFLSNVGDSRLWLYNGSSTARPSSPFLVTSTLSSDSNIQSSDDKHTSHETHVLFGIDFMQTNESELAHHMPFGTAAADMALTGLLQPESSSSGSYYENDPAQFSFPMLAPQTPSASAVEMDRPKWSLMDGSEWDSNKDASVLDGPVTSVIEWPTLDTWLDSVHRLTGPHPPPQLESV